jgi:hypothetical protein
MNKPRTPRRRGERSTRPVRIYDDLAAMIAALVIADPSLRTPELIDRLVRPEITRLYESLPSYTRRTANDAWQKRASARGQKKQLAAG